MGSGLEQPPDEYLLWVRGVQRLGELVLLLLLDLAYLRSLFLEFSEREIVHAIQLILELLRGH